MSHQNEPIIDRFLSNGFDFMEEFLLNMIFLLRFLIITCSFVGKFSYFHYDLMDIVLYLSFVFDILSIYFTYKDLNELKEMYFPYEGRGFIQNLYDAAFFVGSVKRRSTLLFLLLATITYVIVKLV